MQPHEAPHEQSRTLLAMKLGARLWEEVGSWPLDQKPSDLTFESFFEYVAPYVNALCWVKSEIVDVCETCITATWSDQKTTIVADKKLRKTNTICL